jgi:hypothetical protein
LPTLVHVVLPAARAREFANRTDARTAADLGYVGKDAISESFGDGAIRPFRILDHGDVIEIIGWTAAGEPLHPSAVGEKIASKVDFRPWHADKGQEVDLDLLVCPMHKVTDKGNVTERDVGNTDKFPTKIAAYNAWTLTKLKAMESGCRPLSVVRFTETRQFEAIRKARPAGSTAAEKLAATGVRTLRMPYFRGTVKVSVLNPRLFDSFLVAGIGRQRAFGYGALIPTEVLHDLAA